MPFSNQLPLVAGGENYHDRLPDHAPLPGLSLGFTTLRKKGASKIGAAVIQNARDGTSTRFITVTRPQAVSMPRRQKSVRLCPTYQIRC